MLLLRAQHSVAAAMGRGKQRSGHIPRQRVFEPTGDGSSKPHYVLMWGLDEKNWSKEKDTLTRYGDHGRCGIGRSYHGTEHIHPCTLQTHMLVLVLSCGTACMRRCAGCTGDVVFQKEEDNPWCAAFFASWADADDCATLQSMPLP